MLLASTMLELICAQAPYNMRGLFGGRLVLVLFSSFIIGYCFPLNVRLTIYEVIVRVGISLLGFFIYAQNLCWYRCTGDSLQTACTHTYTQKSVLYKQF